MSESPHSNEPPSIDDKFSHLTQRISYAKFLGIDFERHGDELTAILKFNRQLIGNPFGPSLHGGATAAFLEITALVELAWHSQIKGDHRLETPLPKTVSFSIDYLRRGLPETAFARANIIRSGRRFATLHVIAWQRERHRLFAQATGHFQLPNIHA